MVVKHLVHKKTKNKVSSNWNTLKCSPIGPLLQIIGIAPGDPKETSNSCKSSEFSSQFSSSMTEHTNVTGKLTSGLDNVRNTMQGFRKMFVMIQQQMFKQLSLVATQLFTLYVKIGNIFYVIVKHIINLLNIFKGVVNLASSITKLLLEFVNLLRGPVNAIDDIQKFFTRGEI